MPIFNKFLKMRSSGTLFSSIPIFLFGSYYLYNQKAYSNFGECKSKIRPYFQTAWTLNPKYDKRCKGGEDALYLSPNKRFVCVMDGVGGWIEILVDSGIMTKEMVKRIEYEYEQKYCKGELENLN